MSPKLRLPNELTEPLLFVAISLTAGIVFADGFWVVFRQNYGLENINPWLEILLGCGLLLILLRSSQLPFLKYSYGHYRILYLLCFLLGGGLHGLRMHTLQKPLQVKQWHNQTLRAEAITHSAPTRLGDLYIQEVVLTHWQVLTDSQSKSTIIPLRLIYPNEKGTVPFGVGQRLLLSGTARTYPIDAVQEGFQRRQFWFRKAGIVGYIKPDWIKSLAHPIAFHSQILNAIESLRQQCNDHLHRAFTAINHPEVAPLAAALALGIKNQLPQSILEDFATLGALHALAVSGAHLMIVASLIFWWPNLRNKRFKKSKPRPLILLAIVLIVLYAGMTGWSASVMRAVLMSSISLIGWLMNRKASLLNSLGATLLLLLLYDSNYLFDVGLQLSMAAVAGIAIFQPWFAKLYSPKTPILRYLWSITVVAFAANIGTLPISMYYFHQIPVLFLVGNLYIIWATEVLLILALAIIVFGFIHPLSILTQGLAWIFWGIESLVLTSNRLLASLPIAQWKDIYLPIWMIASLYAILWLLILAISRKSKFHFTLSMVGLGIAICCFIGQKQFSKSQWHWCLTTRYPYKWTLYADNLPIKKGQLYPAANPIEIQLPAKRILFFPTSASLRNYRAPNHNSQLVIIPFLTDQISNNPTIDGFAYTLLCLKPPKNPTEEALKNPPTIYLTEEAGPFSISWPARP